MLLEAGFSVVALFVASCSASESRIASITIQSSIFKVFVAAKEADRPALVALNKRDLPADTVELLLGRVVTRI